MEKVDYRKQLKHLYHSSARDVGFVDVPPMQFLMIDGEGDPNTSEGYKAAVETLFGTAYTIKFLVRRALDVDYGVMPLEGLWWTDGDFSLTVRDNWRWMMLLMQPEVVTRDIYEQAVSDVQKKALPALSLMRFETFHEGRAGQIMHKGAFANEVPTVERLNAAIVAQGGTLSGKHHEIYLNDLRRTAPDRLHTVIRHPFVMGG